MPQTRPSTNRWAWLGPRIFCWIELYLLTIIRIATAGRQSTAGQAC